jgi:hypothetical protein
MVSKFQQALNNGFPSIWSLHIAFLVAAINELDILAADIGNAYLRIWSYAARPVIIARTMHGLKSSGAAWHAQLSETLYSMNFKPSLADPDIWP